MPLLEHSEAAALWVPAFAGKTREHLVIATLTPIPSQALSMRDALMALTGFLILRKPPPGSRVARPEDRLRGCLEEPTVSKNARR